MQLTCTVYCYRIVYPETRTSLRGKLGRLLGGAASKGRYSWVEGLQLAGWLVHEKR